jgi:hypothetical protein
VDDSLSGRSGVHVRKEIPWKPLEIERKRARENAMQIVYIKIYRLRLCRRPLDFEAFIFGCLQVSEV